MNQEDLSKHQTLLDIQLLGVGVEPSSVSVTPGKMLGTIQFITRDGVMRFEETPLWEGLIMEQRHFAPIHGLGFTNPYFLLHEIIEATAFAKIVKFLKTMYDIHHSESEVMLLYRPATDEKPSAWTHYVPPQKVTHGSVNYQNNLEELKVLYAEGFIDVGTIHSHADFDAFHSGIDIADEENAASGIHLTVGHLNSDEFSLVMSGVIQGRRFAYRNLDRTIHGIKVTKHPTNRNACRFQFVDPTVFNEYEVPEEDKEKVKSQELPKSMFSGQYSGGSGYNLPAVTNKRQQFVPAKSTLINLSDVYESDGNGVPYYDVNGEPIPKHLRKKISKSYQSIERGFFSLLSIAQIPKALEEKWSVNTLLNFAVDSDFGKSKSQTKPDEGTKDVATS